MAFSQSQQMKKEFRLPMVPGTSCGEEMLRRNYHRSHLVGGGNGQGDCATQIGQVPPDMTLGGKGYATNTAEVGAASLRAGNTGASFAAAASAVAGGVNAGESASSELAGCVLRFSAYTVEQVFESPTETERVRKAVLNFFLEDGTMSVSEPRTDNSGIAYAFALKRHVVPHPDGSPVVFQDLRVGEPIVFYGKTYLIYDADEFTRDFLTASGVDVPPALTVPEDNFSKSRSQRQARAHDVPSIAAMSLLNKMLTPAQVRGTQQFLAHDREVLRCDCTWDDSMSLHGYKHFLTLYYFLADNSIALVEKDTQNSGRDPFPNFFSRQRIAKVTDPSGRFDSSTLGSVTFSENADTVYYDDSDIRIGNTLNLYGRKVLIHDYNKYTRDYLSTKFGITDYSPLPGATPPPYVPPCSVQRQLTADEIAVKQDVKTDEKRRHRFQSSVVKFLMRMDNHKYEDEIRRFVLAVYPADSTISIYEPIVRNSGIVGGKFLSRQKTTKSAKNPSVYFTCDDFYVGAHVVINATPFVILSSDEHSLKYMEGNTDEFPQSDINRIVARMQAMLRSKQSGLAQAFREADDSGSGGIDSAVLLGMSDKLKLGLSEQEILTVLRFFDRNKESYVSYEEVAGRLLPEGTAIAADDRPWEEIFAESQKQEQIAAFVADPKEAEEKERAAKESDAAARAAKQFLTAYDQRRQLFTVEFRAVTDYARDNLIGVDEFKMCLRRRLQITSISDSDLNALCAKLFTPAFPRLTFEELVRLFNGTSTVPHTFAQIAAKTSS